jgi:HEAT repeat protein
VGAVVLVLFGIGLMVWRARPRHGMIAAAAETPDNPVAALTEVKPSAVAQISTKPFPLQQPPQKEEKPPATLDEPVPEQVVAMPALLVEAPAAPQGPAKPGARQPAKLKRRRIVAEDDLRDQLARAPDVSLTHANRRALVDAYEGSAALANLDFQPTLVLQERPDLARLPLRAGSARQLDPATAATLGTLSRKLHAYVDFATPKNAEGQRLDPIILRHVMREEKHGKRMEWLRPEAVPVLRQLLGHEMTSIRHLLVELLAEISGQRASELLAERAIFDLTPEVRAAAVEALRPRPREQFRHVLMKALRYPWAPAADHAAEALAALSDREAAPHLVTLLNLPDPSAPFAGTRGSQLQRQLVRVNHNASCLMCHAPAQTMREPVLGIVPGVQRRQSTGRYGVGREQSVPFWVRADVTFFRQDFSEMIAVGPARKVGLPTLRFDYLVRTRPLGPKEAKRLQEEYADKTTYEQREAVLFALRELTGQDAGPGYEDWLKLYPTAEIDTEAARLTEKLVKTPSNQRDAVLTQLRDDKGAAVTPALARALPKLPDAERPKVREALVKRLARMPADALREKLHDADAEVRRAAVAACASCNDQSLIADLIPLLSDSEPPVAAEAQTSLKGLTGQDLGSSAAAWQEWLEMEGLK